MNQLVGASEADPDLGFMARMMALCSLPRTNPGNRHQYKRVNGPYKLVMIAGADNKLPYGNLPRLLVAWVCTEAVRTQSREPPHQGRPTGVGGRVFWTKAFVLFPGNHRKPVSGQIAE